MDQQAFRSALKELGISQSKFAQIISTDATAVNRWAKGKAKVPGAAAAYLGLRLRVKAFCCEMDKVDQ